MTLSFHKYGNQFFPGTGKFGYSAAQSELTVSTRNSIFECIENRESRIENRESRLEARGSRLEARGSSIEYRGSRIGDRDAIMTVSFGWELSP